MHVVAAVLDKLPGEHEDPGDRPRSRASPRQRPGLSGAQKPERRSET